MHIQGCGQGREEWGRVPLTTPVTTVPGSGPQSASPMAAEEGPAKPTQQRS